MSDSDLITQRCDNDLFDYFDYELNLNLSANATKQYDKKTLRSILHVAYSVF